jgi:hypothetical protein
MKLNKTNTTTDAARDAGQINVRCWDEGSSCSFILLSGGRLEVTHSGGIPVEKLVQINRLGLVTHLVKRIAKSFNSKPGCEYNVEALANYGTALFYASSGTITFSRA